MKAAIYAQYRSDYSNSVSIGDQVARCRKAAEEHGLQVLEDHIYSDVVTRATQRKRPGYSALLAAVRDRKVNIVLVDDFHCLVGNSELPRLAFVELELYGVRLISAQDGLDTSKHVDWVKLQLVRISYEQVRQDAIARQRRRTTNRKVELT